VVLFVVVVVVVVGVVCSSSNSGCCDLNMYEQDKFMGQFTVHFNASLVESTEVMEQWFPLASRKAKDKVTGSIHLKVTIDDVVVVIYLIILLTYYHCSMHHCSTHHYCTYCYCFGL